MSPVRPSCVAFLERVAARAADEVGAQQHEQRVGRHGSCDLSQQRRRGIRADQQQVAAQRRLERQSQHEIEIERRQHQPRGHQRQLRRRRLDRHQHGAHAEQWRGDLDRRLVPAQVQPRRGEPHHDEHQRQLQAEAPDVRTRQARADQQPVIDDREAEHRGQCHDQAHADPWPRRRAVTQQELAFELAVAKAQLQWARTQHRAGRIVPCLRTAQTPPPSARRRVPSAVDRAHAPDVAGRMPSRAYATLRTDPSRNVSKKSHRGDSPLRR